MNPGVPGGPVIDGDRLLARFDQLAASAPGAGGGVTRLAWSDQDLAARRMVSGWLAGVGTAHEDAVGNLVVELAGTDPSLAPLVMGSHLDTVEDGGALDGAYGVVAGAEVVLALAGAGHRLRHPLRLVAWSNEEGVVAPPFTGSRAAAGTLPEVPAVAAPGGAPPPPPAWPALAGYLELHIEQGPVLDRSGIDVGVVTGITGCRRGWLDVGGRANHAGTTPMDQRSDALVAAARMVLAVEALAGGPSTGVHPVDVATVGALTVTPGNANVVPGAARLSYDLRSLDDARCDAAVVALDAVTARIARETGTTVARHATSHTTAVPTDAAMRGAIGEAAAATGLRTMELASGAGHDAQHLAGLGPMGMIFVPSIDGVSHNPAEATAPQHLVAGARTLLGALLRVDLRSDPTGR